MQSAPATIVASGLAVGLAALVLLRHRRQTPRPVDAALLRDVEAFVFDCDGVIYKHKSVIEGVPKALAALRRAGKRIFFVTNAAGVSRVSLANKLTKLGVDGVKSEHCITSASAAAAFLTTNHPSVKRAYVVGGGGLFDELRLSGIEPVGETDVGGLEELLASGGLEASLPIDAVVVGMLTDTLCYHRLAKAAAYARDRSRAFVGTNPDASYPAGATELLPAGGCNVRYVSYGAEREPDAIVGKPSRDLAMLVGKLHGLKAASTLMVGDRTNTDIAFGKSVGWRTLLVLTGCHGLAEVASAAPGETPDYVTSSVADLAAFI